jgi:hypothetical protein
LNAGGTLVGDVFITRLFAASLNGNGSIFANPLITKFAASSLNANASLNASALVSKLPSSSLTGAGTLAAELTVGVALLLDLYPNAAAAYSLRKLRTAYSGSAIRVRRSSDNTEQDIGFTALGVLDESALTTFCGVGNGFVTTWYDQSGNANNATQTTAINQYRIVDSGVIITNLGKPALFNNSSSVTLLMTNRTSNLSVFLVRNITLRGGARNFILGDSTSFNYHSGSSSYLSSPASVNVKDGSNYSKGVLTNFTNTNYPLNSTDLISMIHAGSANSNSLFIDRGQADNILYGYVQEVVLYSTNQGLNRINIQNNINTYYAIY